MTLGEQATSPSPPPCRHAKNPVTGHCKHCLLATRHSLCVASNPCHLHIGEDVTFWQKVDKHEANLKTRRDNEKKKRALKRNPQGGQVPELEEIIDIDNPASPDDTAAPRKVEAPIDPRDVVTVPDSNEQSPVPPHSPAASVDSLHTENDDNGDGERKEDVDESSDGSLSLLDVSRSDSSTARTVLPRSVQHERKSNAKMFTRVVGAHDARAATVRLALSKVRGGAVQRCKVIRPRGIPPASLHLERYVTSYRYFVLDVFDMSGFSDKKRAALRQFEAQYDNTHREQSLLPHGASAVTSVHSDRHLTERPAFTRQLAQPMHQAPTHPMALSPYGQHSPYVPSPYGQPPMGPAPFYPPGYMPVRIYLQYMYV